MTIIERAKRSRELTRANRAAVKRQMQASAAVEQSAALRAEYPRVLPSVTESPAPTEAHLIGAAAGPTFGPWAEHSPNCKCNVCR